MSDDAIVMLRAEHRELRRALRTFTRTRDTETARRAEIAGDLCALLSAHVRAETDVLYPRIRELVPALDPLLRVPEERHRVIEEVERRLDGLEPYDARLAAAVRVLDELVTAHIDQDETRSIPGSAPRSAATTCNASGARFGASATIGRRATATVASPVLCTDSCVDPTLKGIPQPITGTCRVRRPSAREPRR